MKEPLNVFLLLLFSIAIRAQRVEILKKTDTVYPVLRPITPFDLIDSSVDDSRLRFVATISVKMKRNGLSVPDQLGSMLAAIQIKANKLGANSFKIRRYYSNDSTMRQVLTLDTYLASDSIRSINESTRATNRIYVFSNGNGISKKKYKFKFNGKTIELGLREYFVYDLKIGEAVTLTKGPFGEERVEGYVGSPSSYLMLDGFEFYGIS